MKLKINKIYFILFVILAVEALLLVKLKFTAWPEMILWPYLNLHGWQFYKDIAIAHTPLLLYFLDIFYKVFGVGIIQLKVFTWLVVLLLGLLVFKLSSKIFNRKFAVITLALFFLWQLFFEGNGLWFDLFMTIFIFVSFFFIQKKRWLLAGLFWALAFVSKQTAFWFLIPIGAAVIKDYGLKIVEYRKIISGVLIVLVPSVIFLSLSGILPSFYNWAINFGIFILPKAQGQIQLPDLKNLSIAIFPFLVFFPLILSKEKRWLGLLLWALAGMAGAYPRFEYFHFQPAIPFLAIASALVFSSDWHKKELIKAFIPVYVIGCLYLFAGFLVRNFDEGTRFYEAELQGITAYIKVNNTPGSKIFVMNWWDNIYALSDTFPATDPWVPQLSWYQDVPGVQEKEVKDLSISRPKMIILLEYSESGLGAYGPQQVYDYVNANYRLKEKVDGADVLIPK